MNVVAVVGRDAPATAECGLVTVTSLAPGAQIPVGRDLNCEKVTLVVRGAGQHLGAGAAVGQGLHDIVLTRPGEWSGFRNTGDQPAVLLSVYGSVTTEAEIEREGPRSNSLRSAAPAKVLTAPDPIPTSSTRHPEPLVKVGNHRMFDASTGTTTLFGGLARFEAGGYHTRHRHPGAEEMILFFNEGASVAGENDDLPLGDHELVVVPVNAWHGVKGAENRETKVFYAYLGVADRDSAGVELWDDFHKTSD